MKKPHGQWVHLILAQTGGGPTFKVSIFDSIQKFESMRIPLKYWSMPSVGEKVHKAKMGHFVIMTMKICECHS